MKKKHYGKFKVRLYMHSRNVIDRYTLVFPYPKWLTDRETKAGGHPVHGFCISCNQASDGTVLRCASFEYIRWETRQLGARVSLEKMSPVFQQWARTLETLWQEALEYDDQEHWDNFAKA